MLSSRSGPEEVPRVAHDVAVPPLGSVLCTDSVPQTLYRQSVSGAMRAEVMCVVWLVSHLTKGSACRFRHLPAFGIPLRQYRNSHPETYHACFLFPKVWGTFRPCICGVWDCFVTLQSDTDHRVANAYRTCDFLFCCILLRPSVYEQSCACGGSRQCMY